MAVEVGIGLVWPLVDLVRFERSFAGLVVRNGRMRLRPGLMERIES